MIATAIVEIPMSCIVSITVYLACIWATALYLGAAGYDDEMFCIVVASVFWPLFLLAVGVFGLSDWLEEAACGHHGNLMRVIIHYIGKLLHYVFIPFRPFALGRKMAAMWKSRRRQEGDDNGNK